MLFIHYALVYANNLGEIIIIIIIIIRGDYCLSDDCESMKLWVTESQPPFLFLLYIALYLCRSSTTMQSWPRNCYRDIYPYHYLIWIRKKYHSSVISHRLLDLFSSSRTAGEDYRFAVGNTDVFYSDLGCKYACCALLEEIPRNFAFIICILRFIYDKLFQPKKASNPSTISY